MFRASIPNRSDIRSMCSPRRPWITVPTPESTPWSRVVMASTCWSMCPARSPSALTPSWTYISIDRATWPVSRVISSPCSFTCAWTVSTMIRSRSASALKAEATWVVTRSN